MTGRLFHFKFKFPAFTQKTTEIKAHQGIAEERVIVRSEKKSTFPSP